LTEVGLCALGWDSVERHRDMPMHVVHVGGRFVICVGISIAVDAIHDVTSYSSTASSHYAGITCLRKLIMADAIKSPQRGGIYFRECGRVSIIEKFADMIRCLCYYV